MENQWSIRTLTIKQLASILVTLDIAAWIGFGIAVGLGLIPGVPEGPIRWLIAALAEAAGGAMLLLFLISRKHKWTFFPASGTAGLDLFGITRRPGWIARLDRLCN
jgi:hypothetical protein